MKMLYKPSLNTKMVQALTILSALHLFSEAQKPELPPCLNGRGVLRFERMADVRQVPFSPEADESISKMPASVLFQCQNYCLKNESPRQALNRMCGSFDFIPGKRFSTYSPIIEFTESKCFLIMNEDIPGQPPKYEKSKDYYHYREVCYSGTGSEESAAAKDCPERFYVMERVMGKRFIPKGAREVNVNTLEECQQICLNQAAEDPLMATSICRAGTFDHQRQRCYLSTFTKRTHTYEFLDDPVFDYFENTCLDVERRCPKNKLFWTKEVNAEMTGPYDFMIFQNMTLQDCKDKCLLNKNIYCRSIEYDERSKTCVLSDEDSVSRPEQIKQSASDQNIYMELTCIDGFHEDAQNQIPSGTGDLNADRQPLTDRNLRDVQTAFQLFRNRRLELSPGFRERGRQGNRVSLAECLDACLEETSFQCRSVIYSDRQQQCKLSEYDQINGNLAFDPDFHYFENLMSGSSQTDTFKGSRPAGTDNVPGRFRPLNYDNSGNRFSGGGSSVGNDFVGGGFNSLGNDRFDQNSNRFGSSSNSFGGNRFSGSSDSRYDSFGSNRVGGGTRGSFDSGSRVGGGDRFSDAFNRFHEDTLGSRRGIGGGGFTSANRGTTADRFGFGGSKTDNFGTGTRGSADRFGSAANRFGSGADRLGGSTDRFGGGADRFGSGADRFGSSADRFGSGADRFGSSADRFGGGADRFGGTADRFGGGQSGVGSGGLGGSFSSGADVGGRGGVGSGSGFLGNDRLGGGSGSFGADSSSFGSSSSSFGSSGFSSFGAGGSAASSFGGFGTFGRPGFGDGSGSVITDGISEVSQQCNPDGSMEFMLRTSEPFYGRIYTFGYYDRCFYRGGGSTVNLLKISAPRGFFECGTTKYGDTTTNIVVVQSADGVMTALDKRYNLTCTTVGPGDTVVTSSYIGAGLGAPIPIEYLPEESRLDSQVRLQILYNGRPTTTVAVGDPLTFRIESLAGRGLVSDIFATNVVARDPITGRAIELIDSRGCPVQTQVFPALGRARTGDGLETRFSAFKIPESNMVVFEARVRMCRRECEPAVCRESRSGNDIPSYGRRRRRNAEEEEEDEENAFENGNVTETPEEATTTTNEPNLHPHYENTEEEDNEEEEETRVNEVIRVYLSEDDAQEFRDVEKASFVSGVCVSPSEYYSILGALLITLLCLLVSLFVMGFCFRRHRKLAEKNAVADSSNPTQTNRSVFPGPHPRTVNQPARYFPACDDKGHSSIDLDVNISSSRGGRYSDPSEPIYTDPSLFERQPKEEKDFKIKGSSSRL